MEELGRGKEECLVPCTIWCKILLGNATLLLFAAQAVTDVYLACLTALPRGIHASVFDSSYLNRAGIIIGTFINPKRERLVEILFFEPRNKFISRNRLIVGRIPEKHALLWREQRWKRLQFTLSYVSVIYKDNKLN